MDKKHVVFGKVVKGLKLLSDIEKQGTEEGEPKKVVEITDCGEVKAAEE